MSEPKRARKYAGFIKPWPWTERRDEVIAVIRKYRGNIRQMAGELGICRRKVYDVIHREGLESEVARARRAPTHETPAWLSQTRSAIEEILSHGPG